MSTLQNLWGDYVHVYKFEQGGGGPQGYWPTLCAAQVNVYSLCIRLSFCTFVPSFVSLMF